MSGYLGQGQLRCSVLSIPQAYEGAMYYGCCSALWCHIKWTLACSPDKSAHLAQEQYCFRWHCCHNNRQWFSPKEHYYYFFFLSNSHSITTSHVTGSVNLSSHAGWGLPLNAWVLWLYLCEASVIQMIVNKVIVYETIMHNNDAPSVLRAWW